MKPIKCFSVRLEQLVPISDKCYIARSFDGREDLIPKSQVFGPDYSVTKSEAWWISEWILKKKNIQWSQKKAAYFNQNGEMVPNYKIEKTTPTEVSPVESNEINELLK